MFSFDFFRKNTLETVVRNKYPKKCQDLRNFCQNPGPSFRPTMQCNGNRGEEIDPSAFNSTFKRCPGANTIYMQNITSKTFTEFHLCYLRFPYCILCHYKLYVMYEHA